MSKITEQHPPAVNDFHELFFSVVEFAQQVHGLPEDQEVDVHVVMPAFMDAIDRIANALALRSNG